MLIRHKATISGLRTRKRTTLLGASVLTLALAVPLAPATAAAPAPDGAFDRSARLGWSGAAATAGVADPTPAARRAAKVKRIKKWSKPRVVAATKQSLQSYDIARNAKGQGVLAWVETRGDAVRPWFRRISAKGKLGPTVRLRGWIKKSQDGGIAGQVAASIDKKGRAVVAWTATRSERGDSSNRTVVTSALVSRKNKVTIRPVTTDSSHPPANIEINNSPNGHTVVWWNGIDPQSWGNPQHHVLWRTAKNKRNTWAKVSWTRIPAWMPDEGGTATVARDGLVTATWVERNGSQGRLRALTWGSGGQHTDQVPATGTGHILNSSHTATTGGNVTVSFMDATYAGTVRTDNWYTVRRSNGTWGPRTTVPKQQANGYTWDIAGNDSGKVAMIALGYSSENPPEWLTVTAGVQQRPGGAWDVRGVHPRTPNTLTLFTPRVHMTRNGATVVSYRDRATNGVAWLKGGKWRRSPVNPHGDFKFASDRKSRVSLVDVVPKRRGGGWRLVLQTKKF